MTEIPQLVRTVRAALGLSQARLARLLCVDVATVKRWEAGKTAVQGVALVALLLTLRTCRRTPRECRVPLIRAIEEILYPDGRPA